MTDAALVKQERRVRAKWLGGTKVELRARNLQPWVADEPKAAGGNDEGPTPREMALGALAACVTVITHKAAKGLDFKYEDQSVEVRGTADPRGAKDADNGVSPNFDYVEVRITLVTDEPEDRIAELKRQHHGRCPISALFRESGCELVENWTIERP
ncbi:MAG: OsmC family protein [bacterium]